MVCVWYLTTNSLMTYLVILVHPYEAIFGLGSTPSWFALPLKQIFSCQSRKFLGLKKLLCTYNYGIYILQVSDKLLRVQV